jgi:hypothetical protein
VKRFTDTEKWRDPWFRRLKPEHKLAWDYICTNCDNAGVWVVDWDLFSYLSGATVEEKEVFDALEGRVADIGKGRWWIQKFIRFQFGELVDLSRVHQSVVRLLHQHGIHTLWIEYTKSIQRVADTPKDKDIAQDKDKDTGKGSGENHLNGEMPSLEGVQAAVMTTGIPPEFVAMVYETWNQRSGKDGAGVQVEIVRYVRSRWTREGSEWNNGQHRAQQKGTHASNRPNRQSGSNRNHGTLNNPNRYSKENLPKLPNYHGPDKVRAAKPSAS